MGGSWRELVLRRLLVEHGPSCEERGGRWDELVLAELMESFGLVEFEGLAQLLGVDVMDGVVQILASLGEVKLVGWERRVRWWYSSGRSR